MAYLNDPNQQNPQGNVQGMNSPQQQQLDPNGQVVQPLTSTQNAQVGADAPSQPTEQAPTAGKPPVASGSFTNLKSYLQANQPGAQKLAQSVTKGLQGEASQIGSQVQQQRNVYQQQIQTQNQAREAAAQQAQQTIQKAQSLAGGQTLAQDDLNKFRDLATGRTDFKEVSDINLVKQDLASQELQRRADSLKQFSGRQAELQRQFGQVGQPYTAGQSKLDAMILQGGAKEFPAQARQVAQGAQQGLGQARDLSKQEFGQLLAANQAAREQVLSGATQGSQKVLSDVDTAIEAEKVARQQFQQKQLQDFYSSQRKELDDLESYYGQAARQRAADAIRGTLSRYGAGMQKWYEPQVQQFINSGSAGNIRLEDDFGYMQPAVKAALGFNTGLDTQTLQNLGYSPGMSQSGNPLTGKVFNAYEFSFNQLAEYINQAKNAAQKQKANLETGADTYVKQQLGTSLGDYIKAADVGRETIATDTDRARYAALQSLVGQGTTDLAAQASANKKLIQQDQIKKLLNKYGTTVGRSGAASL